MPQNYTKRMTSINTTILQIASLAKNDGQIEGLPANPRFIKDEKFAKLKASIQENPEMLALRELLVYQHGKQYVIIGGNMRYEAMRELGYTEAPCKVIPADATTEQLRAYTLKDNSGYGEWDWDLLSNQWDMEELDAAGIDLPFDMDTDIDGNEEIAAKDDEFDETTEEIATRCQKGDIWQLGNHRLMCGDSTSKEDVTKLMDGHQADLVVTDPPYNVAITNSQGMTIQNDNMASEDFRKFLTGAFAAMESVMKQGAAFYVWFASCEHINFEKSLNAAGLKVREELIWNKNAFVLGRQDYQHKYEPCLYGWKDGAAHYFFNSRKECDVIPDGEELDLSKMKKDEMRDLLKRILNVSPDTDVLNFNKPTKNTDHPTMKPVELFGYLVRNSSRKGQIVLDLFGGSGTTMVVAEQMERSARLMELDPHYCDVILARWEKLTGKQATKIQ